MIQLAPPAFFIVCLITYFPHEAGSVIPALAIAGAVLVLKKGV